MKLFSDQPLRSCPHIAVISAPEIQGFVIITPLLRGLKEKYPDCVLDFLGNDLTEPLESDCTYIDWRISFSSSLSLSSTSLDRIFQQRRQLAGPYDLAIFCDRNSHLTLVILGLIDPHYLVGGANSPLLRQRLDFAAHPVQRILLDLDWNAQEFFLQYPGLLRSRYIAELLCRLAYIDTDFYQLEVSYQSPNFKTPDLLIHVKAKSSVRMWVPVYWQQVITWCSAQGYSVGLIGDLSEPSNLLHPDDFLEDDLLAITDAIDLRGKLPILKLAGALRETKLFIGIDDAPLHIAAAVGCQSIGIFGNHQSGDGASPIRLWAPRATHVRFALSQTSCTHCEEHQFENHDCLLLRHYCMLGVSPGTVIEAIQSYLNPCPVYATTQP